MFTFAWYHYRLKEGLRLGWIVWLLGLNMQVLTQPIVSSDSLPGTYMEGVQADYEGDYPLAIELFQQVLVQAEEKKDSLLMARCYNSLGVVNTNLGNYDQALSYVQKALGLYPQFMDSVFWSNCLLSQGNVYNHLGKKDSAKQYYQQALAIKQILGDQADLPVVLGNLASIGWAEGDLTAALKYDEQALTIHQGQGNRRGEADASNNLAYVYREMEQLQEAKRYALTALRIAEEIKARQIKLRCLINLSTISARLGEHEAGFGFQRQYIYLKDSLYSEDNQRLVQEMEAKYDTERKERELAQQNATIAQQEADLRLRGLLIMAVVFMLILSVAILLFWFQRRRWQMQLNLQAERREAERWKELEQFKSRFFTNITHEFRTPLTVIIGLSEGLVSEKNWQLVHRNAQQLLRLINQLLDLSKLEVGKLALRWVQVDLVAHLRYLTESYQSLAVKKGLNLHFETEIPTLMADIDPEKVQSILGNLLANAFKYSPEEGKVVVRVWIEEGGWACSVTDFGPGIPQTEQNRIFDRFAQGEKTEGGTGIGLALTKELLELMGGRLNLQSEVGQGSTFTFWLPLHQKAPISESLPSVPIATPLASASSLSLERERPHLLLIEDHADVVAYLQTCLSDAYDISVAPDGAQGIEMAIKHIPDAIVSDVMMPQTDGFIVCQTLKQDERTSHIPIILLTARADMEDKLQGLRYGADAYLPKPFVREELLIRLEQMILLRQKLQHRYHSLINLPSGGSGAEQAEDQFIRKVRDHVLARLTDEAFSVEKLAELVQLSRTQLYRKIKALTGRSVSQFVNLVRLEEAQKLLRETDLTVSEIGYQVGFADPGYFMRVFAREVGMSAGEWRRQ